MLNYYCLTVIGSNQNIDHFIGRISNYQHNSLLLPGVTIFTFETVYEIDFIEKFMEGMNFILSKMNDLNHFTANVLDPRIHDELFGDYTNKKIEEARDTYHNLPTEDSSIDSDEYVNFEEIDDNAKQLEEWMKELKENEWDYDHTSSTWHRKDLNHSNRGKNKEVLLTVDEILDKISAYGINKLTNYEKKILDDNAKKQ